LDPAAASLRAGCRERKGLLSTAHGHEHIRVAGKLLSQHLRPYSTQINPHLFHHLQHLGVDALRRLGAGRSSLCFFGIGQMVEERRRHLRPAGIVHAGKDYFENDSTSQPQKLQPAFADKSVSGRARP
jgi:hypothetical protein